MPKARSKRRAFLTASAIESLLAHYVLVHLTIFQRRVYDLYHFRLFVRNAFHATSIQKEVVSICSLNVANEGLLFGHYVIRSGVFRSRGSSKFVRNYLSMFVCRHDRVLRAMYFSRFVLSAREFFVFGYRVLHVRSPLCSRILLCFGLHVLATLLLGVVRKGSLDFCGVLRHRVALFYVVLVRATGLYLNYVRVLL